MATTSIWKIEGRIDQVLNYVDDEEKTATTVRTRTEYSDTDVMAMRDVMDYAVKDTKTDNQKYVSGINCDPITARAQMISTKEAWGKSDGIVAFHGYQSFAGDEVTPEQAHHIGVELAERLWGDRFEVIVATHLNTKNVHNHFVLNSVSFADGKRFYRNNKSYRQMRNESDRLCREYSLSVIDKPKGTYPKTITEWRAEQHGDDTWKTPIRNDIDKAISQSVNFPAFVRTMKTMGYTLRYGENIKYMSVKPPWYNRSVRIHRLGDEYSEDAIKTRLREPRTLSSNQKPKQKIKRVKVEAGFKLTRLTWCIR